jgi:dephospho-CoA kinase
LEIQQIERLTKRDNCTKEHAKKMIASQIPIEGKKKLADYLIDNSGTIEETKRQVEKLVEKWRLG